MDEALHMIAGRFGTAFEVIEPHLETALAAAADPERSMVYLERLLESGDDSILDELVRNPRVIESLITIFSGSQFLAEILLRNPQNIDRLHQRKLLTQRKNADQVHVEAAQVMQETPGPERLDALRRYHRGEVFRIGTCDLLTLYDLRTVTRQ